MISIELKEAESNSLLKLSKLNDVAVSPKPIERQSVSLCLRIYYYGKLRQGSGGTYILSAQSVIKKIRIQRAKLSAQLKLDISNDSAGDEHECELCKRLLTNKECEIFDNLEALEESVGSDVVAAILYIAGYLQKQADQIRYNDTTYYYDKFGKYFDQLNKGSLVLSQDHLVQWCIYWFVLFTQICERVCRTFFDEFVYIYFRKMVF